MPYAFSSADVNVRRRSTIERLWDEDAPLPCTNGSAAAALIMEKVAGRAAALPTSSRGRSEPNSTGALFPIMPEVEKPQRQVPPRPPHQVELAARAARRRSNDLQHTAPAAPSTRITPRVSPEAPDPLANAEPLDPPRAPRLASICLEASVTSSQPAVTTSTSAFGASMGGGASPRRAGGVAAARTNASQHSRHILARSQRIVDKDSPLNTISKPPNPRPPKPPE